MITQVLTPLHSLYASNANSTPRKPNTDSFSLALPDRPSTTVSISESAMALARASGTSSKSVSTTNDDWKTASREVWESTTAENIVSPNARLGRNMSEKSEGEAREFTYSYVTLSAKDILYDRESFSHPPLRLASTGEVVTEEMMANFNAMTPAVIAERTALYQAEVSKGTPWPDIMAKLIAFNDSLPEDFLKMSGWNDPTKYER